jgi:uncharacterized protein YecT (DUF1311 family)
MRFCLTALVVLLGLLSIEPAYADCTNATAPLDQLICNTPDIAAKDRALNEKYHAAMAQLSDAGKQHLKAGERKWLALVRAACGSQVGQSDGEAARCLAVQYDERLAQLDGAAKRIGPYLLSRIDDFAFQRRPADDKYGGLRTRHYSRPYIDQPSTPETEAWNRMVAELADQTERALYWEHTGEEVPANILDMGTMSVTFTLGLGSEDFLSVAIDSFMYLDGYSHGWGKISTSARLMKLSREVKIEEIFEPGSDWEATLRAECEAAMKERDGRQEFSCVDVGPQTGWIPTQDGPLLVVYLDAIPYSNVYLGTEVDVRWTNLRPLLRADLPFAIPPE